MRRRSFIPEPSYQEPIMDTSFFLPILTMVTLLAGAVFGYVSAQRTEERRKDPYAPKSTLSPDTDSHGKPADA
jgi:hypothetical protein